MEGLACLFPDSLVGETAGLVTGRISHRASSRESPQQWLISTQDTDERPLLQYWNLHSKVVYYHGCWRNMLSILKSRAICFTAP
jgi:hypothetical protein